MGPAVKPLGYRALQLGSSAKGPPPNTASRRLARQARPRPRPRRQNPPVLHFAWLNELLSAAATPTEMRAPGATNRHPAPPFCHLHLDLRRLPPAPAKLGK